MQNIYQLPLKKSLLIFAIIALTVQIGKAQSVLLPYSYQLDQKFNSSIYSVNSSFHTALKPFLVDSTLSPTYNAIMDRGVDSSRVGWILRKIFNEHLFDVNVSPHTSVYVGGGAQRVFDIKNKEYTFYADYLTDLQVGRDFTDKITTDINTRGYQLGGTIGDKFSFYSSGFENSSKVPTYLYNIITALDLIPGQAYDRDIEQPKQDWSYVTATMSYTPIKQLNITMGEDKTFIGDGYRSLLLSDFSPNTPLLRLTANLGKVQYMIMWDYMEDPEAVTFDSFGSNRRKWGGFHYLDWNVTNRLSLGYFNAFIAEEANDNGNFHGFDANFFDPIVYTNALNSSTSSQPDNILTGFTGKYKIFDKTALYAQLLLDRFTAGGFFSGGSNNNTNGFQLGLRGADLAGITNFNYLIEYNTVRPYTYATATPITSYSNYDEPLGDPFGANFREFVGILNYSIGRFDFMGEIDYVKYGADTKGTDYGANVMLPFVPIATPVSVGEGVLNNVYFAQGTVSFLINPKTNLRFEAGAVLRADKTSDVDQKTVWLTFGLRSSFRQIYNDL
jgi:hypothetical protein